jgi:ribA/ribD-fused uncharacterized protein
MAASLTGLRAATGRDRRGPLRWQGGDRLVRELATHELLAGRRPLAGRVYPTAEHAYQAAKATTAADHDHVALAPTPGEAKQRGQEIASRSDWLEVREQVMLAVLRAKFAPGSACAGHLLATGDAVLVEGNTWHDNTWGDCRCGQPACAVTGDNLLGRLLQQVRDELRASSRSPG